jgi:predicted phosphodiesterase
VGDIHGDLKSLVKIVNNFTEERVGSLIFLGDYVDRGQNSLVVLTYLMSLAIAWPNKIQLLKGNHEDLRLNDRYGFKEELLRYYPKIDGYKTITEILKRLYDNISLCAITPSNSFCCHGGIPEKLVEIEDFNKIPKPHSLLFSDPKLSNNDYLISIYDEINWNDPVENQKEEFTFSYRGLGMTFNEQAVERFLKLSNCERIIRAHESSRGGFQSIFGGKVLHVFSTEPYFNKIKNAHIIHENAKQKISVRKLNFQLEKELI